MKKCTLPKREEKREKVAIGEVYRKKYRTSLIDALLALAWELYFKIYKEFPNWENDAPRVDYSEHKLIPFLIRKSNNASDEICIYGIGYDVDNIFFVDANDEWYELDEMTMDELCDALSNIEFNLDKVSNNG